MPQIWVHPANTSFTASHQPPPVSLSAELKFECLATWRTGSDTFIYGGFSGYSVMSRDDSYRCFVSTGRPAQTRTRPV